MNGRFAYISSAGRLQRTQDSANIPADAKEIVEFHVEPPPQPHTDEDHEMLGRIEEEFRRVYTMIYPAMMQEEASNEKP